MIRAYLEYCIRHGTLNWDLIATRILLVALVSAVCCRTGDAARTWGYANTEYLQFQHLTLFFPDRVDPVLENLRLTVDLHNTKFHKTDAQPPLRKHIMPIGQRHACPIHWLLIHCLRYGLVEGPNNIDDLLAYIASRPNRRVVWTQPRYPVLCAFL